MTEQEIYVRITLIMKNKVKNYIVSSADWEVEVDDVDPKSAATSAMFYQLGKKGNDLLLSTIVMVNRRDYHMNNCTIKAQFFPTSRILRVLGLEELANKLKFISQAINRENTLN